MRTHPCVAPCTGGGVTAREERQVAVAVVQVIARGGTGVTGVPRSGDGAECDNKPRQVSRRCARSAAVSEGQQQSQKVSRRGSRSAENVRSAGTAGATDATESKRQGRHLKDQEEAGPLLNDGMIRAVKPVDGNSPLAGDGRPLRNNPSIKKLVRQRSHARALPLIAKQAAKELSNRLHMLHGGAFVALVCLSLT